MARTKEFDPDAALRRALDLFWERGYEATSLADLVEHVGVARASLYGTFGTKHALFLKALERYLEVKDAALVEALGRPGPALPPVRALIERYAEESVTDLRGCMVVNTAVELAARDAAAARLVERSWTTLEASLRVALTRARAQGELAAGKDPQGLARLLVVLLQGLRVMGRTATDPQRVRDAARQASRLLE